MTKAIIVIAPCDQRRRAASSLSIHHSIKRRLANANASKVPATATATRPSVSAFELASVTAHQSPMGRLNSKDNAGRIQRDSCAPLREGLRIQIAYSVVSAIAAKISASMTCETGETIAMTGKDNDAASQNRSKP